MRKKKQKGGEDFWGAAAAETPAAAPQPTSVLSRRSPTPNHWPTDDPIAEPI